MAASWAQSLLGGCYLLAGPIASALANHFGCRVVTIAGSLLAFGGFMLSVLVPALPILYVTFGIVGGIGFGLIYLPAIVIVNQYFEKRRAFALGLAVCGSGIGTTIFSQIFPLLLRLNDNNWRTFLMNVAIIVLLCILCGLCFKSPQPDEKQVEEVTKIAEAYHEMHPPATILDSKQVDASPQTNGTAEMIPNSRARERIATEQFVSSQRLANRGLANRPFLSTIELHAAKHNAKDVWSQHDLAKIISKRSMHELNRPLSKMAIFYYGSTVSLSRRTARTGMRKNRIPSGDQHPSRYLSNLALQATDEGADASNWRQGVRAAMQSMLDISLFTSPSFIILAISGFLTLCCLFVPFIYLGEQASQVGVSKERQAFLLTSLGVTNIVGRILCGIISDLPSVDPLMVSNVAIIAGGVGTFCVPLLTEYWMYVIYTIPFALAVASFGALRSVICVELLGLERLSSAFGILLLFMGIAALVGPPTAAFLKDLTGNYDLSFYLMGFLMALSGVICIPLRSVSAYEERKRQKAENENQQAELQPLKAQESGEA
uniref:Monocarboxylate transporter 3 n=1 Tax=Ascaris suum TaxID=6253 RepID=F1L0U5_ASCSU